MTDKMPARLKILNSREYKEIYSRPQLSQEDRFEYFSLSDIEHQALTSLRSTSSKAFYILQYGYFRLKNIFFAFELDDVQDDMQYIITRYFKHAVNDPLEMPHQHTRRKHEKMILESFSFRLHNSYDTHMLTDKAKHAAKVSGKPTYIFQILSEYLAKQRIVLPSYRTMQDIISAALSIERQRLGDLLERHLTPYDQSAINQLLEDTGHLHEITLLRREPKDYKPRQIAEEIKRREQIRPLYDRANDILKHLALPNETIGYYASLVNFYSVYQLKRLSERDAQLYLLCFIDYRFRRSNDLLISSLLYHVRKYWDAARLTAKDMLYEQARQRKDIVFYFYNFTNAKSIASSCWYPRVFAVV
jgi:hypothetical protein